MVPSIAPLIAIERLKRFEQLFEVCFESWLDYLSSANLRDAKYHFTSITTVSPKLAVSFNRCESTSGVSWEQEKSFLVCNLRNLETFRRPGKKLRSSPVCTGAVTRSGIFKEKHTRNSTTMLIK